MTFAAETVPKPVTVTVQPPVHVPTSWRRPRGSVRAVLQGDGERSACACLRDTQGTLTCVTLPLLLTLRVAVSDDEVQPVTAALPAPSFPAGETEARGRRDADRQEHPDHGDPEYVAQPLHA